MKYVLRTLISLLVSIALGLSSFLAYVFLKTDNYIYLEDNKSLSLQELLLDDYNVDEYIKWMLDGTDQNKKDTLELISGHKFSSLKSGKGILLLLFKFDDKSYLNAYVSEHGFADIHFYKNHLYIVRGSYIEDEHLEVYVSDDTVECLPSDYINADGLDYDSTHPCVFLSVFPDGIKAHTEIIIWCSVIFVIVTIVEIANDMKKSKNNKSKTKAKTKK